MFPEGKKRKKKKEKNSLLHFSMYSLGVCNPEFRHHNLDGDQCSVKDIVKAELDGHTFPDNLPTLVSVSRLAGVLIGFIFVLFCFVSLFFSSFAIHSLSRRCTCYEMAGYFQRLSQWQMIRTGDLHLHQLCLLATPTFLQSSPVEATHPPRAGCGSSGAVVASQCISMPTSSEHRLKQTKHVN